MDQPRAAALPASVPRAMFQKSNTNLNSSNSTSPTQASHHARQQQSSPHPQLSDGGVGSSSGSQQMGRPPSLASMNPPIQARSSREKISETSLSSTRARHSSSNAELKSSDGAMKENSSSGKGLSDGRRPSKTFSKSSGEPKSLKQEPEAKKIDERLTLITSLKGDLSKLQQIITCTICIKFLYEPYTLACGHTFCYGCICHWFGEHKTCPECRTKITVQPAPAYLIKEMIDIFIHRADLLTTTETPADHIKMRKEESDSVERDKADKDPRAGGLFRGCFRQNKRNHRLHNGVIPDAADGVDRCPQCLWELENRYCAQCDATFEDDGRIIEGDHSFSDMDETEDSDGMGYGSDDDLDVDFDMDEDHSVNFGYGGSTYPIEVDDMTEDGYNDYLDHETGYAIRRELARGSIRPPVRRVAAHSAAGSRARRYSQSIVSDMQTSEDGEMGVLAEESGEEEETESMRDFVVDDESNQGQARGNRSARTSRTMQGPAATRRIRQSSQVGSHSQASQPQSTATADDDGDDDGGPISNGRRTRARHVFYPPRRLGRRGPIALSITTATEEEEQELDEDTEALLHPHHGYSQLDHDTPEEDMGSEIPDDDDDMAMAATVASSASFTSSERSRLGGSVTPTADRPNPSIRPPSRTQNGHRAGGNRPRRLGLRRMSSSISTASTVHYEDGEADDDESDPESVPMDADGDIEMNGSPVTGRRNARASTNGRPSGHRTQASRGTSITDAIDLDTDSTSDASVQPHTRRQRQRARQPEYDPRISMMFAEHQLYMRDSAQQSPADMFDRMEAMGRGRTQTPLNFLNIPRPRTANRNRGSQASTIPALAPPFSPLSTGSIPPFSPISVSSGHSRNSSFGSSAGTGVQGGASSFRQLSETQNLPRVGGSSIASGPASSPQSNSNTQTSPLESRPPRSDPTASSPNNTNSQSPGQPGSSPGSNGLPFSGSHDGPANRSNTATPVRRGLGQRSEVHMSPPQQFYPNQSWGSQSPGLNLRLTGTNNPFAAFSGPSFGAVRPRTLREAPSNATIRPRTSQRDIRNQAGQPRGIETVASPPPMRNQPSQRALRGVGSRHGLRSQGSISHIRRASASPSPSLLSGGGATVAGPRNVPDPSRSANSLSPEERSRRGREVMQRRQQELFEQAQQRRQEGNNQFVTSSLRLGLSGQTNDGTTQQQQNQPASLDQVAQFRRGSSAPVSHGLELAAASGPSLPSLAGNLQTTARAVSETPSPRPIQRRNSRRTMVAPGVVLPGSYYNTPLPSISPTVRNGAGNSIYGSQLNTTNYSRVNPMMAGGEARQF